MQSDVEEATISEAARDLIKRSSRQASASVDSGLINNSYKIILTFALIAH